MENYNTKLNIYAILYYENKITNVNGKQSKQRISPHIDKQCYLLKGIPIVTDALTPTECLLGLGVGVKRACKANKVI